MIASLEDAWNWYQSVRTMTNWMARVGERYWLDNAFAPLLSRDNTFRHIEQFDIAQRAARVKADLDDLGVLLLFSVFEAIVRERALAEVTAELPAARHPALRHALRTLCEALEHGSFAKVLEAYKELDADLVEQVAQVRRYRNWVAHGRRASDQPSTVEPSVAYNRLGRFLNVVLDVT